MAGKKGAQWANDRHQLETLEQTPTIRDEDVGAIKRYKDFATIDWVDDALTDNRFRVSEAKAFDRWTGRGRAGQVLARAYSAGLSWLVLAMAGAVIGVIAALINIATEWLSDLRMGRCSVGFYLNEGFCCSGLDTSCAEWRPWASFAPFNFVVYVAMCTAFGATAAFLVASFAPYAAGSGISEIKVIVAGFVMKGFLGARTLAIKSLTLPITIASGLSVGKEGPSVHYAVCVGNVIASMFAKYRTRTSKMSEVLCACAAAGVGVAFGSPMGGVLFSLEEMSSSFQLNFMWRSYFCALVATIVLAAVNPFRTGQLVLFSVKYDQNWHFFEIIPFAIIGAFGGFLGLFIIKWNLRAQAFRKKYLAKYPVQEVTVLAFVTALICYFNEFLRIDMTESMQILFHECSDRWDDVTCKAEHRTYVAFALLAAVVIRTLLVIVSYGSKVPAGIFVPSMAIGALFGRFVGTVLWALHDAFPKAAVFASCHPDEPCISPGTYAFLGAAACLSGVMHITVTVVIVMYELTGALSYIIPTMIVVGVTKVITDAWGHGGIADRSITANGFPFIDANEIHEFNDAVSAAMERDPATIPASGWTLAELDRFTSDYVHQAYPVVDSRRRLLGYVHRQGLEDVIARRRASPGLGVCFDAEHLTQEALNCSSIVQYGAITVSPDTALEVVAETFAKLGPRSIYVVSQGRLEGLVTRKDVLRFQHKSEHVPYSGPTPAEQMDQQVWETLVRVGSVVQSKAMDLGQTILRFRR